MFSLIQVTMLKLYEVIHAAETDPIPSFTGEYDV